MINIELLKNPIALAIIAGIVTYLYMYWDIENKHKKNPKATKPTVSLVTPAVVTVIVWFIASSYFDKSKPKDLPIPRPPLNEKYKLVQSDSSGGSQSFHFVKKNDIRIPPTDVFIDLAKF